MLVCCQKHARSNRLSHNEYFHLANVAQRQFSVKSRMIAQVENPSSFAESFDVVIK